MLVHVPEVGVDMVAIPEKQEPEWSDDYSPLVTKGGQSCLSLSKTESFG